MKWIVHFYRQRRGVVTPYMQRFTGRDEMMRFDNVNRYQARHTRPREAMRAMYVTQPFEGKIRVTPRNPKNMDRSRLMHGYCGDHLQLLQARTYGTGHVLPTVDERADWVIAHIQESESVDAEHGTNAGDSGAGVCS